MSNPGWLRNYWWDDLNRKDPNAFNPMFMPDASKKPGPWPERFNIPASVQRDQTQLNQTQTQPELKAWQRLEKGMRTGMSNIPYTDPDRFQAATGQNISGSASNPVGSIPNPVTRLNQATNTAQTQTTPGNTNMAIAGKLLSAVGNLVDRPRAAQLTRNQLPGKGGYNPQVEDDRFLQAFLGALRR